MGIQSFGESVTSGSTRGSFASGVLAAGPLPSAGTLSGCVVLSLVWRFGGVGFLSHVGFKKELEFKSPNHQSEL